MTSPSVDPRRQPRSSVQLQAGRAAPLAVLGICLLGLLLRLPGFLGYWLNPDEGIYYSAASWPSWSRFWADISSNVHPPLFFLLVRGVAELSLDLSILRAASLVCGVLAILALYLATRDLLGRGAGLLAALLVALSPGAIVQSQLIRPYAMQLAVLAFALWFLVRFTNRRRSADLAAWGGLLLVAVLLHYGSWLFLANAIGACTALLLAGRIGWGDALRLAAAQMPAMAAMAALWLRHLGTLSDSTHMQVARESWLRAHFHQDLQGVWSGLVGLVRYWFGAPHDALALVLLGLGLGLSVWRRQILLASLVLVGLGIGIGLSLAGLYPFGESRHTNYLVALLIPCLANAVGFLLGSHAWWRLAAGALLALLILIPQPLRELLRTDEIPPRKHHELVIPRASVERTERILRETRSRPGVVLVDEATYFVLMPFFHPSRLEMRTLGRSDAPDSSFLHARGFAPSHTVGDAVISRFPWGSAEVVVIHAWRVGGDLRRPESASHVFGFLRLADRAFPDLGLSQRGDTRIFFAGWSARSYRPLRALDRKLGGGCVVHFEMRKGLGWAQLDSARCLEIAG